MKLAQITSKYRASLIANVYKNWIKRNAKVLDIGCGTGVVADYLANSLKLDMVGCDIDKYLLSDIKFKKMASRSKLPFKKNEFSFSMFNDVLHHTEYINQAKLLSESLRVSNKVLIFELKPTLVGKLFDFILNKIHNFKMEVPYTYREKDAWLKLFKELKSKAKVIEVKTPIWYPFTHVAFLVEKATQT